MRPTKVGCVGRHGAIGDYFDYLRGGFAEGARQFFGGDVAAREEDAFAGYSGAPFPRLGLAVVISSDVRDVPAYGFGDAGSCGSDYGDFGLRELLCGYPRRFFRRAWPDSGRHSRW